MYTKPEGVAWLSEKKILFFCHVSVRKRKFLFLLVMILWISGALLLSERVFSSMKDALLTAGPEADLKGELSCIE